MIILKSPDEIKRMKIPCRIVAETLQVLREKAKPGISTLELNDLAEREARRHKAIPAFKGYSGYPFALCCSLNDQVVHGMPNNHLLASGDILSIDFGVVFDGFYGDAAITLPIGNVTEKATLLMKVTEESLDAAVAAAKPGNRLSDISYAVQSYVEAHGFSVVRDFVGHGIGKELHESPQIPNFGLPGKGVRLKPGMVFAIEPMINEKGSEVKVLDDGWTAVTCDGGLSAHFEHTVAVTEHGPEILTKL
ncbi:type I methionyl aminopeptidase [Geobacter sp. DSM 9736]|uniref:type I methionyl aminopeptidase n=1 Tax=Geobacter sp. DSM 9736 TaxID=1277350 RepID=UPI000B50D9E8|nr:type I methionyl aminopeptidase [Geobacter sp. DSM 9736]SNB46452.1 methionine aminopeptidase, type I [Geobacter sp. DSM 9736]